MQVGLQQLSRSDKDPAAILAATLLLLALLCLRPGILGELLTPVGVVLTLAAALTVIASTRRVGWSPMAACVLSLIGLAQGWIVVRYSDIGAQPGTQGMILLLIVLIATAVILGDRATALAFGRLLVSLALVLCASCVVTLLLWLAGFDVVLFQFFTGQWNADIRLPFTPTIGSVWVNGIITPRFSGLGREPGWTGMYLTFAAIIWRYVGRPTWWGYLLLSVGVICTVSTSSFGIFVMVIAYEALIRVRPYSHPLIGFGRHICGLLLLAGSLWLALYAPVFGVASKADINALSLDERNTVAQAGLNALLDGSLGAPTDTANSGIGLVAATAAYGWPYFVLMCAAFLLPLVLFQSGERPVAAVATLFLTVLVAQPPQDSIGVYVLLLTAFACAPRAGKRVRNEVNETTDRRIESPQA